MFFLERQHELSWLRRSSFLRSSKVPRNPPMDTILNQITPVFILKPYTRKGHSSLNQIDYPVFRRKSTLPLHKMEVRKVTKLTSITYVQILLLLLLYTYHTSVHRHSALHLSHQQTSWRK